MEFSTVSSSGIVTSVTADFDKKAVRFSDGNRRPTCARYQKQLASIAALDRLY
jgi:hypothetical protein